MSIEGLLTAKSGNNKASLAIVSGSPLEFGDFAGTLERSLIPRNRLLSFFAELKRRNVFRVVIAYLALAWLLIEVAGTLFPGFGIPDWAFRFVVIVLALGFLPTLIFSWAYEITPEGLKREKEVVRDESVTHLTAKRLDKLTIGMIIVALAFIMIDRFWLGARLAESPATAAVAVSERVPDSGADSIDMANSIAVLPFANRSANPDDAHFVDGIHDDLLTYISQIGSIKTISRTSVMKYRDTTQSIPEIARELGVATVLEGGVQRAGNQVRINVQLIDASNDDHLWSSIYDRQLTAANIFAIQSEIAESIASALRATLTPEARERIDRVPTENLDALEAYFLGKQSMATRTVSELAKATEYFESAVAEDPAFALAWVSLADTYLLRYGYGGLPRKEAFEKGRAAGERALQLDPNLGEAHASEGKRRDWDGDHESAEAAFKRALQLNPNYAPTYQWYSQMLGFQDRTDEALEMGRQAVALDPKSAIIVTDYAGQLAQAGRIEEALEHYERALQIEPQMAKAYLGIGFIMATQLGRMDEGLKAFRKGLSIEPLSSLATEFVGLIYLDLGDKQQAEIWRDRAQSLLREESVSDVVIGLHLSRGEKAEALKHAWKDVESSPRCLRALRVIRDHEIMAGSADAARELFEQGYPELFDENALTINWLNQEAAIDLAYLLMQTGEHLQAERLLNESEAAIASRRESVFEGSGFLQARAHILRGDRSSALASLRQAADDGRRWSSWYFLEHDPIISPLHDEPEFQAIKTENKAEMAEQLARVREWEASGELHPVPGTPIETD